MSSLSIGASALNVDQQVLNLIGQNIANANTTGYHRQVADLAALSDGTKIGAGVEITLFRRLINNGLESEITQNTFQAGNATAQLDSLNQVQSSLGTSTGSLADLLNQFFSQLQQLSTTPDDTVQRQVFLSTAADLTGQLNGLSGSFAHLQSSLDTQMQDAVSQVNQLAPQIGNLNRAIHQATLQGTDVNNLLDQRDQLIGQLAQLTDVRTIPAEFNQVNVVTAGQPLVLGDSAIQLKFSVDNNGNAQITAAGGAAAAPISGGTLGGLLQIRNTILPQYTSQLDSLTHVLMQNVDQIQGTGLGLNGPMTFLAGSRAGSSASVPLAQAKLAFPPQAGSLFISVTNQANGQRTLNRINIDPATQSLQDVANAISGIGNVQAFVDGQTGTLRILAAPGYAFDFAGQLPSAPQSVSVTGTAVPQIAGTYTGSANDTYTFRIAGSGTVGVTPSLALNVYNSKGTLLGSENIGQGYTAGTPLGPINGVTVNLGTGTVNDGDSFSTQVVANPDTAGILPALGLGTFFSGHGAADIQVNADLLNHPTDLAASRSGQPGDNTNLQRLVALASQPLLDNGSATFSQHYANMVSGVGSQIQNLTNQQTALGAVGKQLNAQQQSLSGVDPNQELINLLQFQQSFQMSVRYVSIVTSTISDLLSVIQ